MKERRKEGLDEGHTKEGRKEVLDGRLVDQRKERKKEGRASGRTEEGRKYHMADW
jgi:hypothetical protein